jgi:hypothetical protein
MRKKKTTTNEAKERVEGLKSEPQMAKEEDEDEEIVRRRSPADSPGFGRR